MFNSPPPTRALSAKQKEFVKQYVLLRSGRAAAIAAGYSKKRAGVEANELLQNPAVKRELGKAMALLNKAYGEQLDCAMEELFHCLTRRGTDLVDEKTGVMLPVHEMPERINASMDGYEEETWLDKQGNPHLKRKVKLVSKATAIDMAFKIKGAYAPDKSIVGVAPLDLTQLYGMPEGALDADKIEVEE